MKKLGVFILAIIIAVAAAKLGSLIAPQIRLQIQIYKVSNEVKELKEDNTKKRAEIHATYELAKEIRQDFVDALNELSEDQDEEIEFLTELTQLLAEEIKKLEKQLRNQSPALII